MNFISTGFTLLILLLPPPNKDLFFGLSPVPVPVFDNKYAPAAVYPNVFNIGFLFLPANFIIFLNVPVCVLGGAFILIFLIVLVFLSGSVKGCVIGSILGGVTKGVVLGGTNDLVFKFWISCDIALFFLFASLIKSSKDLPLNFFDDFGLVSGFGVVLFLVVVLSIVLPVPGLPASLSSNASYACWFLLCWSSNLWYSGFWLGPLPPPVDEPLGVSPLTSNGSFALIKSSRDFLSLVTKGVALGPCFIIFFCIFIVHKNINYW